MSLFDEFDAELPLPTKILLTVTGFVTAYGLYTAIAMVAVAVLGVVYVQLPAGRRKLDYALLRMPLIGPITTLSNTARFSGTTAILLRAGIPISEVMALAIETTGNQIVREGLRDVQAELLRGEGLSKPLANTRLFPPMLVQMVEVGEETGTLDANLETMAEFYTSDVDERITRLTSMIQPAMTLVIGGVVALIALAVIMPMYDIMQSIRQQ